MPDLTRVQADALSRLRRDGSLYAYNGVSIATARALARQGYGTLSQGLVTRRGPLGGSQTYRDWVLHSTV